MLKAMADTPMIQVSAKAEPKDIFLHLLSMVTLYVSAGSFLALLFQFVNYYLPDPLEYGYAQEGTIGTIRIALSALIVAFPVYLLSMRFLKKTYAMDPSRLMLRVRKWLVYFTLFVAAVIIMGDLVSLIYNFLEGDLTMRFFLKVLSVFFVAGSIFYYYFVDIRKSE